MAKRPTFDFDSFTKLLGGEYSRYISRDELEELENLWYMKKIDRAFSKAAAMYRRLPERKITEGLRRRIHAFQDATMETSPRYTAGKHFDPERYAGYPTSPDKHYDREIYVGSPTSLDRRKTNTNLDLVHYINILARGIRENNLDDIEVVRNLEEMYNGIQALRRIAYDVEGLFQQIQNLEEHARNKKSLWDTAVNELLKEKDVWQSRYQELEQKYSSLLSSHMTKVDTIIRLEMEKKAVNDRYLEIMFEQETESSRLRDKQHKLEAQETYFEALHHKNRQLSDMFDNLRYQNTNLEEKIRKYTVTVECLEKEISTLKKRNSSIKHQTDAKNIILKRATVHGATLGIYDNEAHDRETAGTEESSLLLQKRVEELEAKCSDLGERNSSLINQVQAKKVQLKKATKNAEAIDTNNEELQDRLKEAEQRIKQIENDKRELEEECIILKERTSVRNGSSLHHPEELDKLRTEHYELRARLLFQESIGNQDKSQKKENKLSKESERSTNNLTNSYKGEIFQTTKESADQRFLYENEITQPKDRIRELEQGKARHGDQGTGDISYSDRLHVTRHKKGGQDHTDCRNKELEEENNSLRRRLQRAIDIINQPKKTGSRGRDLATDDINIADRREDVKDDLGFSRQVDSKVEELELENSSLKKRLQDALDMNKQTEKGELRSQEHGTNVPGFIDRLSETQGQRKQLEKAQSQLEELEKENRSLEERFRSTFGKEPQAEVSESRVRELETEISRLQEKLRDANNKINQLERDNSRLNDLIALQYALHRSPSDVSSSRVRELERENRSLENRLEEAMNRVHELDREVQKGSKDSYKSHSGKHKKKVYEKSDARVKDLERENSSLQDSTSKLRRNVDEKDHELRRVTSQLQKAEDDNRELLTRLNSASGDFRVQQGSGTHLASLPGIATRGGEGLTEIHREKEKVLQAVHQAKQLEQENQHLQERKNQLQSLLEEKDQELEKLQSELRLRGATNTNQDQDLTVIQPQKEGVLQTESQTRQLEQDKRELYESNQQLQSQLQQQQREVERLQTELRQRDETRPEQNMTDMHREAGGALLTERQIERFEQQKENLLDRNRDLQKQIDQLKEEVSRLTREHRQKDNYCNELSRNLTDMRRERDMAVQNDGQVRQFEQEKQELQQRLDEALIESNKVGELESLVMTLENQKREYEERLSQEQVEEEAGIYSEGAPSKLKKAKKIKTHSGEKLHKDKEHLAEDREQSELDRVKSELQETKQENDGLKKRLNQLQNLGQIHKEGDTDSTGLAQDIDQIDSKMDPQIDPERQENELRRVKFELQVIKKQKSDLQKQLSDLQAELESVHRSERRPSRSERVHTDQFDGELEQQSNELDRVKSELQETKKQNEELQKRLEDALSASGKLKESKALLAWQTNVRGKVEDGDGDEIVEERIQKVENAPNLPEMPEGHEGYLRLERESIYVQEDIQRVKSELLKAEEEIKNLKERLRYFEQEAQKSQELANTARRLRRERDDLRNRLTELENGARTTRELENTATRLRKERQDLRARNAELEQKIAQSRHELERLSADLRESREASANLSERLRTAESDSEKLKELEVQVMYLQNEKKQGEERLKRVERETTKREKRETRSRIYGEERGSLPDQSPRLQEQLEKQQTETARITLELHQTKSEKQELEDRLGNAGQDSKRLDELEVQMIYLQSEKKAAEERLRRLERERSITQSVVTTSRKDDKERGDLEESNLQLQKQLEEQQTDIQRLNTDLKKSQEECQNLRDRMSVAEKKPKKVEDLEVQLIYLLNEKKEAEIRTSRLQRKVDQQQTEIQKRESLLKKAQEQYDDLHTRFSQVASAQLTHDNPNITDLSDSNRPIKLADAYSELYDNEWTEAYSALDEDESNALTDDEIVIQLRDILLDCFEQCTETSKRQLDGIKSLLFSPSTASSMVQSTHDFTREQAKTINDLRKKTVLQAINSVQQKMTRKYHQSRQHKAVEDFVKKCVELCWLMVVQSPPVFIDGKYKSGDPFDKDVFKAFTKSGNTIDYVVWPPLYLHTGGPILCKGTAQGRQ